MGTGTNVFGLCFGDTDELVTVSQDGPEWKGPGRSMEGSVVDKYLDL